VPNIFGYIWVKFVLNSRITLFQKTFLENSNFVESAPSRLAHVVSRQARVQEGTDAGGGRGPGNDFMNTIFGRILRVNITAGSRKFFGVYGYSAQLYKAANFPQWQLPLIN
jgi:hypothetical protein